MYKRLKMHGAETSDSAYMVHIYPREGSSRPASKPRKTNPCYAPGHTPIK